MTQPEPTALERTAHFAEAMMVQARNMAPRDEIEAAYWRGERNAAQTILNFILATPSEQARSDGWNPQGMGR